MNGPQQAINQLARNGIPRLGTLPAITSFPGRLFAPVNVRFASDPMLTAASEPTKYEIENRGSVHRLGTIIISSAAFNSQRRHQCNRQGGDNTRSKTKSPVASGPPTRPLPKPTTHKTIRLTIYSHIDRCDKSIWRPQPPRSSLAFRNLGMKRTAELFHLLFIFWDDQPSSNKSHLRSSSGTTDLIIMRTRNDPDSLL